MDLRQSLKNQFFKLEGLSVLLRCPYALATRRASSYSIPVLVYHEIAESDDHVQCIPWAVSHGSFKRQMRYLYEHNYRPIAIDEYIRCLYVTRSFPKRSVLITFDDGYRNVRRLAYGTLKKYSFPAVVFVACKYIGTEAPFPWDRGETPSLPQSLVNDLLPLKWQEIREMQDVVAVGSHSMSHPHLAFLSREEIYRELTESRSMIERQTGKNVSAFAYPGGIRRYGDFNDVTREILIDTGYKVAFHSEVGRNNNRLDPYLQRRIYVEQRDSLALFESKLIGAYDWTRIAQWSFQRVFPDDSCY